jgi:hypothetical protein
MAGLRVIVSHPTKQIISFNRALAVERMGADVTFLTGLYYKPDQFPYSMIRWLPASKRNSLRELLNKRRIDGLPESSVVSLLGPVLESLHRATPLLSLSLWWKIWDRLASLWLRLRITGDSNSCTILHCFQNSCLHTLRTGRSKGLIRVVEVTLPPLLIDKEQLDQWGITSSDSPDVGRIREEIAEADFVLVQSEFGADTIAALGVPRARILHIDLGLDTDFFVPRLTDRRPGPVRVLFVGTISRRKGVHHLLQAWKELSLDNAELLLAGGAHGTAPDLQALADDVPHCRMLGHVGGKALLDLYQQADFLVHPSLAEGGCAAIHEALGCGLPCVVSSNSTSAVRPGCEGIVVPPGDVRALKEAIACLCQDGGLRKQMSVTARKRAEEALSLNSVCRSSAEIYRRIAESYSKASCGDPAGAASIVVSK